jgi:hypothetical protein
MMVAWVDCKCEPDDFITINDRSYNEFAPSTTSLQCTVIPQDTVYTYREGGTPVHMATKCVPNKFCGGRVGFWIKGKHPNNNKNNDAEICVYSDGDCCKHSFNVEIKKCGRQYYYKHKQALEDCSHNFKGRMCTSRELSKYDYRLHLY